MYLIKIPEGKALKNSIGSYAYQGPMELYIEDLSMVRGRYTDRSSWKGDLKENVSTDVSDKGTNAAKPGKSDKKDTPPAKGNQKTKLPKPDLVSDDSSKNTKSDDKLK